MFGKLILVKLVTSHCDLPFAVCTINGNLKLSNVLTDISLVSELSFLVCSANGCLSESECCGVSLPAFGVAHQAVEAVEVKGDTVLVQGCGPIGLFATGIAKAMGATTM